MKDVKEELACWLEQALREESRAQREWEREVNRMAALGLLAAFVGGPAIALLTTWLLR